MIYNQMLIFLYFISAISAHRQNFGPLLMSVYDTNDKLNINSLDNYPHLVTTSKYTSEYNQITHVYYNQFHQDISIVNAFANVNYDSKGKVISFGHNLYAPPRENYGSQNQIVLSPRLDFLSQVDLTPIEAAKSFANFLNLSFEDAMIQEPPHMNYLVNTTFYIEGFPKTKDEIPVKLAYMLKEDGSLQLVWDMVVDLQDNWYHAHLCVKTGTVLSLIDWVSDAAYRVYPIGTNDPLDGPRKLLVNPAHSIASPAGWHTTGTLKKGTFSTKTIGNNVIAQENMEGGYKSGKNYSPDGSLSLVFDFPLNLTAQPSTYIDAAVTNLFYWNNIMHDLFYVYGFDEKSGNFQQENFGRGGEAGDAVCANAQDGSGYNNANFATPPDGKTPRMRMYVWNVLNPMRDGDLESGIIIHEYAHGISTRLTGGPANVGCLGFGEAGGMGEGWGDFFATILRMSYNDTRESIYPMGSYSAGKGIRMYSYSTSMEVNPSTYAFITKPDYWGVHAKGEVWAEILYEVFWNVVDDNGFSIKWFDHQKSSKRGKKERFGNRMMLQNVVDGLKLQPCYPTFVDARDAIILADKINYKGINKCSMWKGFAKRGLGYLAKAGGDEDFSLPKECEN